MKAKVNCLMDIGSTTTLITHQAARKFKLNKIKNINMVVRSLSEPNSVETSIYLANIWNYQTEAFEQISMKGIDHIGPCIGPNQTTKNRIDDILKPINMDHEHLTWAIDGNIDVLMGGNHARLLVKDDLKLNRIFKPSNLRFYNSPIFMLPLAFGELSGNWTAQKDDTPDQTDFKIEQSREGVNLTRTISTDLEQLSIPYFVKDSPVLSQPEKMTGKIYRKHSRINYYPDKVSDNDRILSSVGTPSPLPAKK